MAAKWRSYEAAQLQAISKRKRNRENVGQWLSQCHHYSEMAGEAVGNMAINDYSTMQYWPQAMVVMYCLSSVALWLTSDTFIVF